MVFLEASVDKIIFECLDTALSRFEFINKSEFYRLLDESYGVKPENIGANYKQFHVALIDRVGIKHFAVERLILQTMKDRANKKVYSPLEEIAAFNVVTDVLIEDSKKELSRRKRMEKLWSNNKHLREQVKKQEAELKSAERMVAIGETAAMVGHDIRNPLQSIIGDLYLLNEGFKEVQDGENKREMQESLDAIQENILYINKIVQDLQDYARPLRPDFCVVNLQSLFSNIFQTINLPKDIMLEIHAKSDLNVSTDPGFIRRALTNLINNAIQAMPKGGKLTVTAFLIDNRVCIIVADTGDGIPDEVRDRMFKPLVTSKSKGQGLGLAVVKRLVDALDGRITFESEKGKGTEFFLELPPPTEK